jgi:hypothetical protein
VNESFFSITSTGGHFGRICWTNGFYGRPFGKISWRNLFGKIWQPEHQMREMKCPHINTLKELQDYIEFLVEREHDYGTCVYAMSLASEAAYNYVASNLGVTGFQASCADLDLIRRTRRIKGPFIILKVEDELYPQYNSTERYREFVIDSKDYLIKTSRENLASKDYAHPNVIARWKYYADMMTDEELAQQ